MHIACVKKNYAYRLGSPIFFWPGGAGVVAQKLANDQPR